jgi:hypothetical protein
MSEHDIGAIIFILLLLTLAIALIVGMVGGNQKQISAWWRWRKMRPDPHKYNDEIKLKADLAVWRLHRP